MSEIERKGKSQILRSARERKRNKIQKDRKLKNDAAMMKNEAVAEEENRRQNLKKMNMDIKEI